MSRTWIFLEGVEKLLKGFKQESGPIALGVLQGTDCSWVKGKQGDQQTAQVTAHSWGRK